MSEPDWVMSFCQDPNASTDLVYDDEDNIQVNTLDADMTTPTDISSTMSFQSGWYAEKKAEKATVALGDVLLKALARVAAVSDDLEEDDDFQTAMTAMTKHFKDVKTTLDDTNQSGDEKPVILFQYPTWTPQETYLWCIQNAQRDYLPIEGGRGCKIDVRPTQAATGIQAPQLPRDAGEYNHIYSPALVYLPTRGPYKPIVNGSTLTRIGPNDLSSEKASMRYVNGKIDIVETLVNFNKLSDDSGYTQEHVKNFLKRMVLENDHTGWSMYKDQPDMNIIANDLISIHYVPEDADQTSNIKKFVRKPT